MDKQTDLQNLEVKDKLIVWKPFMEKYHCDVVCELGVRYGLNFARMIEHKPLLAVAVDIWRNDGIVAHNDIQRGQYWLNRQYEDFKKRYEVNPSVQVYREYTTKAAEHFEDEMFDFIYIDADHTYEGCFSDMNVWFPKLKKGGVMVGDDYKFHKTRTGVRYGVRKAVWTFSKRYKVKYFLLPAKKWGIIK